MTYATRFQNTENPISEGGHWKNGGVDGVDWTNCRTKPGLIFSDESGTSSNQYDDSTCILTGTWGPVQTVQATVFSQNQSEQYFQEVELRLHSTISAHRCTGYEVMFRALHPGGYVSIARWNGPLGSFTYLNQKPNSNYKGIKTGDVVKASIDGNGLIIAYVNGIEVIRAIDTTYSGGNPGIGFWLLPRGGLLRRGLGKGTNPDFGLSAFTATDYHDEDRHRKSGKPRDRGIATPGLTAGPLPSFRTMECASRLSSEAARACSTGKGRTRRDRDRPTGSAPVERASDRYSARELPKSVWADLKPFQRLQSKRHLRKTRRLNVQRQS
jgi:hypothetical protein